MLLYSLRMPQDRRYVILGSGRGETPRGRVWASEGFLGLVTLGKLVDLFEGEDPGVY